MIPTEEMVRVAAIAVRQARNGCITPPENGTEYDEQLARAALSAALAAMWQPIETAPKDGTDILVFRPRFDGNYIPQVGQDWWMRASYTGDCWAKSRADCQPTHWMPLPPAPTLLSTRMGSEKTAESDHSPSTPTTATE